FRDVSQRRQAEQAAALLEANARLELALRGSKVGIWDFDLREHSIRNAPVYSVNLWEPMGYEPESPGPGNRSDRYHPDRWHPGDGERVARALDEYVESGGGVFELEWRLMHKDGSYRWWLNRGATLHDGDGKPIRFAGSSVDITDRIRAEEALRE